MAKIALVTVLFKSNEVLPGFFKSISNQGYKDYILYLVDNSANDNSDKVITKCLVDYPVTACRHIKNNDNVGVAEGNNIGIKQAIAEGCSHILLLNNDIEFVQNYVFSTLLSLAEKNGEHIVVPKISYFGENKLWMAGGYMDKWRALGVHYGFNKDEAPKFNIAKHCTYAPTCFMLIEKTVFDKIGYMDSWYFAYYDDTDFVYRACSAGFKIYYEPVINILHKVSSSTGTNSSFYVYYSNRNKIYFIRKNLKGFVYYFSLCYTLLSRVVFYLKLDKERRKKLLIGLKEGFQSCPPKN